MKNQVLIVEDNDMNREMLKEILSDEYICLEAENGKEAVDKVALSEPYFYGSCSYGC